MTDFLHVSTKAWTKSSIVCIVTIRCRWFQRIYKSSHIVVCFLKKGVCQHEKIETNPICNFDSNIAFIYYWWNAGTASSTAFRLVITNHSGYIGLWRCIDNRTSAEIFSTRSEILRSFYVAIFQSKRAGCLLESISITKIHIAFRKGRNNLSNKSTRFIITVSVFDGNPWKSRNCISKGQLSNALYDICSQSRLRTRCSRYSCLIKYERSIQLRLLSMVQWLCQIHWKR